MGDKRRYLSRNPSPRRDKIVGIEADETGNAAADGYTLRYRNPLPGREKPGDMYRKDSLYNENYACDGMMTDEEALMQRMYGDLD